MHLETVRYNMVSGKTKDLLVKKSTWKCHRIPNIDIIEKQRSPQFNKTGTAYLDFDKEL